MSASKFQPGDEVFIAEDMDPEPGHEASVDRGYRMFIRSAVIDSIQPDPPRQPWQIGLPSYHIAELGYWKWWEDRNVFATQEEAIKSLAPPHADPTPSPA